MAHALDSRANSPANELRDALDQVERLVVNPNPESVETLLKLLDKIAIMFRELGQTGVDLRSEEGRWEGIRRRLDSKATAIVAAANRVGGFARLRAQNPPAEEVWWRLDKVVSERRRRAVVRLGVSTAVIVGVLALVYIAIQTFFPPNPDAIFVLETEAAIEEALNANELAEAQRLALAAARERPSEPELWIWSAALSEQMGDEKQAEEARRMALELLADRPIAFWIELGNKRLLLSDFEGAEEAANEALALDEQSAQGYFLLGGIAEITGNTADAITYFEKTFDLAEAEDPQLAVIAKVRMGHLLQSVDPFSSQEPPEETPAGN